MMRIRRSSQARGIDLYTGDNLAALFNGAACLLAELTGAELTGAMKLLRYLTKVLQLEVTEEA